MGRWSSAEQRVAIRIGLIGVVVLSVLTVSGCAVDLVHGVAAPSGAATFSDPPVSELPEQPEEDIEPPDPEATDSAAEQASETDLARRSYYADKVEVTTGCPQGRLTLSKSQTVTRITEDCHKVTVTAAFVTVLAEKIDILTVKNTAGMGHFIVRELDSVRLEAAFSFLYWDRGNPDLAVTGFRSIAKPNPVSER